MLAVLTLLASCDKDTATPDNNNTPSNGNLNISIQHTIGSEALVMNDMRYTNAAGNLYSINLLKYYISNITLHKKDGNNTAFSVYKLIDGALPATASFSVGNLEAGSYDSISFCIGIDPTRNHTGAQDGDLDVSKGMFWTWNTGYIFYKHEGQYKNTAGQTKSMIFHLGTDNAFTKISIPVALEINGNKTMQLQLDVNSIYTSPQTIDFNVDNNRQSGSAADALWISNMKSNFADAFRFLKVE